jgi:hypothetical protein
MSHLPEDLQDHDRKLPWASKGRKRISRVLATFVTVALLAVAASMLSDSQEMGSWAVLLQSTDANGGGGDRKTALMQSHLHMLADNNTDNSAEERNATKEEEKMPNEAEDEAATEKDKGQQTEDIPIAPRPPYPKHDNYRAGWGPKTAWDEGDWAVWVICGPILTLGACMFVFYTFGWHWALGTFVALVAVDLFAYYYNV